MALLDIRYNIVLANVFTEGFDESLPPLLKAVESELV
jgi:hypothetical protein